MFKKFIHTKKRARIINIEKLSTNLIKIDFKTDKIEFNPGEYVTLYIAKFIPRNYSIYNVSPDKTVFSIIVNTNGEGVGRRTIRQFIVHEQVHYIGPLGDFKFNKKDTSENIWFIATGSGISPFVQMINENKNKYQMKLFFSARNIEEIPNIKIDNIEKFYTLTSQKSGWSGYYGKINNILLTELNKSPDIRKISFYICGNPKMVIDIKNLLVTNNINLKNIYFEKFGF